MGNLSGLQQNSVHLLLTNSSYADIYVYDTLKAKCSGTLDSVIEVTTRTGFNDMMELVNMQSLIAEKWLFVLTYKGAVKSMLRKNLGVFRAETSEFLIRVESYKDYCEVRDVLKGCNDMYLSSIGYRDVMFLLRDFKLSQDVRDFVARSYAKDPEKVFQLKTEMENGAEVKSTKDVVAICGESVSSVNSLLFLLLGEPPSSISVLKRMYTVRAKMLAGLCDTLSARTVYNFLKSAVKDVLDIKVLYLRGEVYDSVKGIPEAYDEKRLSRYLYKLEDITKNISYGKIMRLYIALLKCEPWRNAQDGLAFLYNYYIEISDLTELEED